MSEYRVAAGQLRHKVTIQAPTDVADGQGGRTRTWAAITNGEQWASVEPVSAREASQYQRLDHLVTHKIRLRYVSGVEAKQRVLFGSRVFNIRSILNVEERSKVLVLMVEEGVPT